MVVSSGGDCLLWDVQIEHQTSFPLGIIRHIVYKYVIQRLAAVVVHGGMLIATNHYMIQENDF